MQGLVGHKELDFSTHAMVYSHLGLTACNGTPPPERVVYAREKFILSVSYERSLMIENPG